MSLPWKASRFREHKLMDKKGQKLKFVAYVEIKMELMDELSKAPQSMEITLEVRHTPVRVVAPANITVW